MFENPRRGRQARNFTTNVPKIVDLKSSPEQIFSENCRWVPLIVWLSQENGYVEFQDIGYFAVHILPVVVASFFEIWTYTPRGTNKLRTVWTMYCPGLFLTLYAVNNDQVEVYKYLIKPPNPWFVAVTGIFSNLRLVFFPLMRWHVQLMCMNIFSQETKSWFNSVKKNVLTTFEQRHGEIKISVLITLSQALNDALSKRASASNFTFCII